MSVPATKHIALYAYPFVFGNNSSIISIVLIVQYLLPVGIIGLQGAK